MTTFKTIHPENRSELAQADLDALQKDFKMYLNDLSDDHIIALTNHVASNQTSLGKGKTWKQPNLIKDYIESTRSWKLYREYNPKS